MSVRMALAKLCACTCGGAIIGGGAMHVAENPPSRPALVRHAKGAPVRYAKVKPVKRVRRVTRTACVVTRPASTVTTRTYAYPAPLPPPPEVVAVGGGGTPVIIGGSGGYGGGFGGGFFSGGFFGGSS